MMAARRNKKLLILLVNISLVIGLLILPVAYSAPVAPPHVSVALGTAPVGSPFYVICVGMADIISRNTRVKVTVQPIGGGDACVRNVGMGVVNLGMASANSTASAFYGNRQFTKDGKLPILLIAQGQSSVRTLVVRKDSRINSIADIKGKKIIARRKALVELEWVADALLKAYGINKKEVNYIETSETGEAVSAMIRGTVDGAFIPGGIPSAHITEIAQSVDISIPVVPQDKLALALDELGPAFYAKKIPAGTYKGQDKDVYMPAVRANLIANEKLSNDVIYEITKTLFTHYENIKLVHAEAKEWTMKNSLDSFPLPFHPGAIKYYKEMGAWTSEIEKRQHDLLTRSK